MAESLSKMPMQSPQDLFIHELSEIHSAEQTIAKMLSEAQGLVQDPQVKQGLQTHEQETRQHVQNLEQAFQQLGVTPHPVQCHAAQGIQQDLKDAQAAKPSPDVLEGLVVGGAAKTEHFEIAAYNGLIEQARAMGQTQVAQLLQQNLAQEQAMLKQVETIGQQMTQRMAAMPEASAGQQPTAIGS
ncbi:MAG: ferritin-like domain-containing protein [Dehalococcoidia bacterium]